MEDYLRKLRHFKHRSHHGGNFTHHLRRFKKLFILAAGVALLGVLCLVVLVIIGLVWLFNRGDDVKQATDSITSQAQSLTSPLKLESYITNNGQVNTEQLRQTYNALPSQLQDDWLRQLKSQIDTLQAQSGVSSETIQTLLNFYNTLQ
jgi:predicted PurR-regulated permease PerM